MSYRSMQDSASYPSVDYRYAGILARLATANDQSIPFPEPTTAPTHSWVYEQQHLDVDDVQDDDHPVSLPRQIQTVLGPFIGLPGDVTEYQQSRIQICKCNSASSFLENPDVDRYLTWQSLVWHGGASEVLVDLCHRCTDCAAFCSRQAVDLHSGR